ncbi:uncharacterized protein RAG0_02927 [Rhynchosporium agropyri]|uniref:Uncharacterized protein n=1 Tax=Rhynchosporium agropyri TaxID=914238 RepID=A0A1E1K2Z3_9HELO|nr:uncharacterized protein RAG0_02927 [Rhynchosporium agropyri]
MEHLVGRQEVVRDGVQMKAVPVEHNTLAEAMDLSSGGWKVLTPGEIEQRIVFGLMRPKRWRAAEEVEEVLGIPGLVEILGVFIVECRREREGKPLAVHEKGRFPLMDRRWAKDYFVTVHASV